MKSTYILTGVIVLVIGLLFFWLQSSVNDNDPTKDLSKTVVDTSSVKQDSQTQNTQINTKTNMQITELKAEDELVGTGKEAKAGESVTVQYVGSLTNGKIFDASRNHGDQGFTFNLGAGQVIKGWDLGVAGMKEGGKRKLYIPSSMAYGNQDVGNGLIPANSDLIFEVELVKVGK